MKGQQSVEFLVILFILVGYLSIVFGLFSQTKSSLQNAVDKKIVRDISSWIDFINQRPVGTEIRMDFAPFPGRFVTIGCGGESEILSNTYSKKTTKLFCKTFNITKKTCLSIVRGEGGVLVEIC